MPGDDQVLARGQRGVQVRRVAAGFGMKKVRDGAMLPAGLRPNNWGLAVGPRLPACPHIGTAFFLTFGVCWIVVYGGWNAVCGALATPTNRVPVEPTHCRRRVAGIH